MVFLGVGEGGEERIWSLALDILNLRLSTRNLSGDAKSAVEHRSLRFERCGLEIYMWKLLV